MIKEIPQTLPVVGMMQEQKKYIVEREEREFLVKQLKFQYGKDKPETIDCIVKLGEDNEVKEIKQDYRPYLEYFYQKGQIYVFTVKADRVLTGNYYEVSDDLGFFSRVYNVCGAELKVGQNIRCMVSDILGSMLKLFFIGVQPEEEKFNKLRNELRKYAQEHVSNSEELVEIILDSSADESYEQRIDEWLVEHVMKPLNEQTTESPTAEEMPAPTAEEQRLEKLEKIRSFCLYVLEESNMLRQLKPEDLRFVQRHLSLIIDHSEVLTKAVTAIVNHQEEEEVTHTFDKLSASGYLYNAKKQLLKADFILMLCPQLFERKIEQLFNVITLEENLQMRSAEPYVTLFSRMLEHYIMQCREITDNVDTTEGNDELQNRVTSIIKALAIQQLLAGKCKNPPFDQNLNRSRLYRYLTFLKGCNIPLCFEKAYYCLMGEHMPQVEFSWRDVQAPLLIMLRVSEQGMAGQLASTRHFVTNEVNLQLSDTISLSPCHATHACKNQLPANLLPWHHMEVCLNDSVHFSQVADVESMRPYETLWKNLERHLFASSDVARGLAFAQQNSKRYPEKGDIVTVRIDRESSFDGIFHCVIEDPSFKGEGVIDANEIVRYKAHPDLHCFRDENNQQLLLPMEVKSVGENNHLQFEMSYLLNQAIDENFLYEEDEDFIAVVTNYSEQKHTYVCVSDYGLTVSLPQSCTAEHIPNGTFIKARIVERKRGVGTHVGRFMGYAKDVKFSTPDAFNNLMVWYAGEGAVWNPTEKASQNMQDADGDIMDADEMLTADYVGELMKITDRIAVVTSDYRQAYNYLGFTRLLALALNNQPQADYYTKRMKLILLLKHFETNGSIDWNEMSSYEQMGDNVQNYPGLYTQYRQLQTVSFLSEPSHNEELWDLSLSASDPLLKQLAKLVLSYNMMGEFKLQTSQIQIHKKINDLLNIQERQSNLKNFGEEDLHTEFKTSIVFPAGNSMREDVEKQTWVVLHVVCGFMNAEGGCLYLGVNNEGTGIGLQGDAASSMFKGKNFRDSFERYVVDNIAWKLGNETILLVRTEWVDAKGRDVLCIHIKPSKKVVKLDGDCWCRFTSETRELKGETLRNFIAARPAEYATLVGLVQPPAENKEEPETLSEQTVIEETSVPTEDESTYIDAEPLTSSKSLPPIPTSVQPLHEGAYALAYINFLDEATYMHCEEAYYGPARLTIPVYGGCEKDFIVVAYTDGNVMRVPVSHILGQNERQTYSLYVEPGVDICFAALARPTDLLLTTRIDHKKNRKVTRCDMVANLSEENSLNAKGDNLVSVQADLAYCAVINQNIGKFRKITNLAKTQLGADLSTKSHEKLRLFCRDMGLKIPR